MQQKSPRAESQPWAELSGVAALPSRAEFTLCQRGRRGTPMRCGVGYSATATDTWGGWMRVLSWDHWSSGDPQGLSLWGAVPSLTSFLWPWTSPFSLLPASFYRCRSRRVIRADERPREERAVLVHARGVSGSEKQESSAEGPCDGGGGAKPHSSFSSRAAVRLAGPGCLPAPPACTAGSEHRRGCGCRGARQGGPDGLQAPLPTRAVTDG